MSELTHIGKIAGSKGAQELEGALRRASKSPDPNNERTPVRLRQAGLVAANGYTRLPYEFLAYAGELGIPCQAQNLYVHCAFYDRGNGFPFVGMDTLARRMKMSRRGAMRWRDWWVNSSLLKVEAKGRNSFQGIPRRAPTFASCWDWSAFHSLLWKIRELSGERLIAFIKEKREAIAEGVNGRSQLGVNVRDVRCERQIAGDRGNPGKQPQKQTTEAKDLTKEESIQTQSQDAASLPPVDPATGNGVDPVEEDGLDRFMLPNEDQTGREPLDDDLEALPSGSVNEPQRDRELKKGVAYLNELSNQCRRRAREKADSKLAMPESVQAEETADLVTIGECEWERDDG